MAGGLYPRTDGHHQRRTLRVVLYLFHVQRRGIIAATQHQGPSDARVHVSREASSLPPTHLAIWVYDPARRVQVLRVSQSTTAVIPEFGYRITGDQEASNVSREPDVGHNCRAHHGLHPVAGCPHHTTHCHPATARP